MKVRLAIVALALLGQVILTGPAFADPTQEILRVTTDSRDAKGLIFRLDVDSEGGRATRLVYHTYVFETQKPIDLTFLVTDVVKSGATLVQQDKYDVARLVAPKLDAVNGGQVILDYLINGVTGKRGQFYLWFNKDKSGAWQLLYNGKAITEVFLKTNRVLGKDVGISQIRIVH